VIVKEEIFISCEDDIETPYFSSDPKTKEKEGEILIITKNVIEECVSWLEERGLKNTTLYLGIWFEGQMNLDGLDSKIMLRMANIDTHLCVSIY